MRCNMLFWSYEAIGTGIRVTGWQWHHLMLKALSMVQLHLLGQDNENEVQYDVFGHVLPLVLSLALWCWWYHQWHHSIPLVKTIEMKYNMMIWPFDAIDTDISVTWWQWHLEWHHWIPEVNMTKMRCNMTFLVTWCHKHCHWHYVLQMVSSMAAFDSLGKDDQNKVQHHCCGHVMPLAPVLASHDANGTNCIHEVKAIKMRFNINKCRFLILFENIKVSFLYNRIIFSRITSFHQSIKHGFMRWMGKCFTLQDTHFRWCL